MEFTIYETKTRKVKGEDTEFLALVAEISDIDTLEEALEALMEEVPEYLGVELTVFQQEPTLVTVNENPSKYAISLNGSSSAAVAEEEEEDEDEAEDEEEPAPAAAAPKRGTRGAKRGSATASKRGGAKKASPFKSNPKSAD